MKNQKAIGIIILSVLLLIVSGAWRLLLAQGPSGFTKVNPSTIATTSYTDSTVTSGSVYQYSVTATNAAGESGPSNIVTTPAIPSGSGSHSASLSWTASANATGYNVYRFLVQVPAAPGALTVVTN